MESMNFEVPLVTNMHPEPPPAGSSAAERFNGIAKGWSSTNVGEDSMEDLNAALDEALENYDIATKWLDGPKGSAAAAIGGDRKPSSEDAKKSLLQYIDEELLSRGHVKDPNTRALDGGNTAEQEYSEQSTLRIGESLPKSEASLSSQQGQRRRRHSGSIPDATTALSMMGGSGRVINSGSERLVYGEDESIPTSGGGSHRHRSLSDSRSNNPRSSTRDHAEGTSPLAPPRNRSRQESEQDSNISQLNTYAGQPASNGLPPTPKVHMGACFSKVFNGCPLRINCTASWIHPETHNQHILVGADEGIYTLNLNEIHENAMDLLYPRRTVWMFVIKDVLMTLSGKTPSLFRHDLNGLHSKQSDRLTISMNAMHKIPSKFVPKKFALSSKVANTRGTSKCCVGRNPYNGYKYLCGATPSGVFLMQWYDPLNKFMLLKHFDCSIANPPRVFEMVITPDLEYPIVCVNVRKGFDGRSLTLDMVNLNSTASWFQSDSSTGFGLETGGSAGPMDGYATVIPRHELMNVQAVVQLEKDTILVCYDNVVKVVNLQGKLKSSKRQASELHFDFSINTIVVLADSVLAFHKNGMQGRSFKNGDVTQEICDRTRIFKLLGSDRIIVVQSEPKEDIDTEDKYATIKPIGGSSLATSEQLEQSPEQPTITLATENVGVNLYILAGHEDMRLQF